MNSLVFRLSTAAFLVIAFSNTSTEEPGQTSANQAEDPDAAVLRRLPDWRFTTRAYQQEALRLMIEEANTVMRELNLHEPLPITKSNLIETYIGPPALVALGFVSTSNYAFNVDRKFSGLTQRNLGESFDRVKAAYTWPISRLDTNGAFQVATQILTAVRMDVAALNRDCALEIYAPKLDQSGGTHFVPDYWVTWRKTGEIVAFIEFVEPTRSIRQLVVKDPKYILRERIMVPNLARLLNQTNAPTNPTERPK